MAASIDLDAVLRRARVRRRPRMAAAVVGGVLAAAVVVSPFAIVLPQLGVGGMSSSSSGAGSAASSTDSAAAPEARAVETATVGPVTADAGAADVAVEVTLSGPADPPIVGEVAVTLVVDGVAGEPVAASPDAAGVLHVVLPQAPSAPGAHALVARLDLPDGTTIETPAVALLLR